PARAAADFFEFGPFRLDVSNRSLYCSDEFVPLTPKVFETLLLLVEEAGRVVDKEQLMQRVWPDAFVEEGSITNNISTLRKILNPHFDGDGPIATVARRGYRFTASVQLRNESADIVLRSAAAPVTAEPAQQPVAAPSPPPAKMRQSRMIAIVAAGIVALVVAAVLLVHTWKQRTRKAAMVARPSVAVLS